MTTLLDLGKRIYGNDRGFAKQAVGSRSQASDVRHGTALEASADGYVTVLMDGSEESVTLVCEVPVAENQRVSVASNGGTYKVVSVGQVVEMAQNASEAAAKAVISTTDEYAVSDSSSTAPTQGWSTDTPEWTPGSYIWRRVTTVYGDGTVETGSPALLTGNAGADGEDATLLYIHSEEGMAFKNSEISTTMTVTIFRGAKTIADSSALVAEFGAGSYLQWSVRHYGSALPVVIPLDDARISHGGFAFTVGPDDIDTQAVFNCELFIP